MNRFKSVVTVTVLATLLVGCGGQNPGSSESSANSSRGTDIVIDSETAPVLDENSPSEEAENPPLGEDQVRFGETYEYPDGLSVTISKPQPYSPAYRAYSGNDDNAPWDHSDYYRESYGPTFEIFATITNNSSSQMKAELTLNVNRKHDGGLWVHQDDALTEDGGRQMYSDLAPGESKEFHYAFQPLNLMSESDLMLDVVSTKNDPAGEAIFFVQ